MRIWKESGRKFKKRKGKKRTRKNGEPEKGRKINVRK